MKAKALAFANIALVKYWGKENEQLSIPYNSSLSLTLKEFYTITEVKFSEDLKSDEFYLNNEKRDKDLEKISKFVDHFRNLKKINTRVKIKSINHVPTAAGLASSASGFAALGMAINEALALNLSKEELSTYVRMGSGSAIRSLYGGFVMWEKGNSHKSSKAIKIDDADFDICMIAIIINSKEKSISSRDGMKHTVETSTFYPLWPQNALIDLENMKKAIKEKDIDKIGQIAEDNAFMMHASMMASRPSIIYLKPDTLIAIDMIKKLRAKGISAYITMDAGPNVKVIAKYSQSEIIKKELMAYFKSEDIIISTVGSDAYIIKDDKID